jgi:tetratricopeptide (TPR) repeat protein
VIHRQGSFEAPPRSRRGFRSRRLTATAGFLLLLLAASAHSRPADLSTPPDSLPPESEPAPLLIPGRPNPAAETLQVSREREARQQFQEAKAFEAHLPATAIVTYRKALRLDPTLRDANYRMGLLFNSRSQWAEARKCFAAELEAHPDHADAERDLALAMARTGDAPEGVARLQAMSKRSPRDGRIWHALAFAYTQTGKLREAEHALRMAIQLPPKDVEEHRDLGALLSALGRVGEARKEYRRALAIHPRDPGTWLNVANLERRAGRRPAALDAYRHAVAGDSSFSLGYQGQIQLLGEERRAAEMVDVYRAWLAHQPEQYGARLEAVELLQQLGRGPEALALAHEGVERMPKNGQARLIYGMALAGQGRAGESLVALRQAQQMFAGNPAELARVESMVTMLRRAAPDSLRALFRADSMAHPNGAHAAARDSAAGATVKKNVGP